MATSIDDLFSDYGSAKSQNESVKTVDDLFSDYGSAQVVPKKPVEAPVEKSQAIQDLEAELEAAKKIGGRQGRSQVMAAERKLKKERFLESLDPIKREVIEETGPLQELGVGFYRGVTAIPRALGVDAFQEDEALRQDMRNLKEGGSGTMATGQFLGETAPFMAGGMAMGAATKGAPLLVRALGQGAVGAAEGATLTKAEGKSAEEALKSAGVGGLIAGGLEMGIPIIGRLGAALIRKMRGAGPTKAIVDEAGNFSDEMMDALKKSGQTPDEFIAQVNRQIADTRPPSESIDKAIIQAAPHLDEITAKSTALFNKIDESGAVIDAESYFNFVDKLQDKIVKEGLNPTLHPDATAIIKNVVGPAGENLTLSGLERMRRIALDGLQSNKPADVRMAGMIIDEIDDYIADLAQKDFLPGSMPGFDVSKTLNEARELWSRKRRSEMIERAINIGSLAASGPEAGIRNQFRSLLKNPKRLQGFSAEQRKAIVDVVEGNGITNLAKGLGKFGISADQSARMVLAGLTAMAGKATGSPTMMAVAGIGTVAGSLAKRLTGGKAEFANAMIRAGKDARKITQAYFENTPPSKRTVYELSQLLLASGADASKILHKEGVAKETKWLLSHIPSDKAKELLGMSVPINKAIPAAGAGYATSGQTQEENQ